MKVRQNCTFMVTVFSPIGGRAVVRSIEIAPPKSRTRRLTRVHKRAQNTFF